ncbi:MAG: 50S ribosomal protein L3 [Candidatus Pacebacteria bacterium]|nr:50S ribosomal protein L3 [Candidatus Paceibacterota bacterium]
MKFILGTKVNMTEYFAEDGKVYPATIVTAGPITVTQKKTKETDGYSAIQVGFGTRKASRVTKALKGHFGDKGSFSEVREFRVTPEEGASMNAGDVISADAFAAGDIVAVSGTSKGKGFQGVIKRHNFKGGPRSHGQKHSERAPGSIGGGLRNRVPKGMRMGGRTGSDRITVRNLKVLAVDMETNSLLISGAVPGRRGTMLEIIAK